MLKPNLNMKPNLGVMTVILRVLMAEQEEENLTVKNLKVENIIKNRDLNFAELTQTPENVVNQTNTMVLKDFVAVLTPNTELKPAVENTLAPAVIADK